VSQARIARPQNNVRAELDPDFLLQGFLNVDLADDPEASLFSASRVLSSASARVPVILVEK
jgi:hypothetical protein